MFATPAQSGWYAAPTTFAPVSSSLPTQWQGSSPPVNTNFVMQQRSTGRKGLWEFLSSQPQLFDFVESPEFKKNWKGVLTVSFPFCGSFEEADGFAEVMVAKVLPRCPQPAKLLLHGTDLSNHFHASMVPFCNASPQVDIKFDQADLCKEAHKLPDADFTVGLNPEVTTVAGGKEGEQIWRQIIMNCLAKTKYGAVFSTYFPPERGLVVSHCKAAGWNCSISRNPAWANEDEWNLTSNLHFNLIVASPTGDAPVLSASVGGNAGGVTVPPAVKPSVFHGAPAPGPFPLQTTAPTTVSVPPAVLPAHPVPQIPTATQTYANGLSVNAPGVGMYMGGSVQRPMFAYPPTPAHASAAPAGTWGGAYVPGWAFTQPAVGAHGFARGRYQ